MPTLREQFSYLFALKVGEFETLDNSKELDKKPYKRKFYGQVASNVSLFNMEKPFKQFTLRTSEDGKSIFVHRIGDGMSEPIAEPPLEGESTNGIRLAQIAAQQKSKLPPEERDALKLIKAEERRLAKPENQLPPMHEDQAWSDFHANVFKQAEKLAQLFTKGHIGRSWFMVTVGGVPMGPPSETLANAKQTAKLYKSAKIIELKEVQ